MGTFHSHPICDAIPSPVDFMGAGSLADSLMLIYDVCGIEARLWRMDTSKNRYQAREVAIGSTGRTASRCGRITSVSMLEGAKTKTVIIHSCKKGRGILDAFLTRAGHKNKVMVPTYVRDIAKVQVYCAWSEAVLGEAKFIPPMK